MTHANFVKKARKNYPKEGIKKGESYWWWKFRFGGKYKSKTQPKASQLTQSDFLSTLYSVQESIEEFEADDGDEIASFIEDQKLELEQLRDTCQENHDNMPDQLQDSETGELLQNRVDGLEGVIDELDCIDIDVDEDALREEAKDEIEGDETIKPADREAAINEKFEELKEARVSEILDELKGVDLSEAEG